MGESGLPRVYLTSVAIGLFLMSFFTLMWVGNTFAAWPYWVAATLFGVALIVVAVFITYAIRLLRARERFRADLDTGERKYRRVSSTWFGVLFGGEGAIIGITVPILNATGHPKFVVPAIALIVGLHFFPMARLFDRRIDLYLATWTTLAALAGIVVLAATEADPDQVASVVAIAAAVATTTYGVYMSRLARQILA